MVLSVVSVLLLKLSRGGKSAADDEMSSVSGPESNDQQQYTNIIPVVRGLLIRYTLAGLLTSRIGCLHAKHTSEYLLVKHATQTGSPSFSLNVGSLMGAPHSRQTKCSGCHDLPSAVRIFCVITWLHLLHLTSDDWKEKQKFCIVSENVNILKITFCKSSCFDILYNIDKEVRIFTLLYKFTE